MTSLRAVGDLLVALELRGLNGNAYDAARGAAGADVKVLLAEGNQDALAEAAKLARGARRSFHWVVEFPEIIERGGFDAVVGNPPFMGGQKLTGVFGTDYRDCLVEIIAAGRRGSADLSAYFFLRAVDALCPNGIAGLIATKTIAQGDTREVGLDAILAHGTCVYRAVTTALWPGEANLSMSRVWLCKVNWKGARILDGSNVQSISSALVEPGRITGKPHRLVANSGQSFQGSIVLGLGFLLKPDAARELIAKDKRPEERARQYPDCFSILENTVRPVRQRRDESGAYVLRKPLPERWWHHAEKRPALYNKIAHLQRVLPISSISEYPAFAFVSSRIVLDHNLTVITHDDYASFSIVQSTIHLSWATAQSSGLESRPGYRPTDGFETFPFPTNRNSLNTIGETYHDFRQAIMAARLEGLTETYGRFHRRESSHDIDQLRRLHVEMDYSVASAYGWTDLDLGHGYHTTKQGLRYTMSEAARRTVLDRLLALNHERYAEEIRTGLHEKRTGKSKAPTVAPRAQLGLFDSPDATANARRSDPTAALLEALDTTAAPLGKAALLAASGITEGEWAGAMAALKAQGAVEQRGEKRGAVYLRKR